MGRTTFSGPVKSDNGFESGSASLDSTDLAKIDGITNGTVTASKAVVVDSNKDIGDFRNLDAVNVDAGASGTAGSVDVFPTTASKGKLSITAADSAGDTTTTIVNASQSGARTYTIPDGGASTGYFALFAASPAAALASTAAEIDARCDDSALSEQITSGAISVVVPQTDIAFPGAGAATLAAPSKPGMLKVISMSVDNGDVTLALTNVTGGSAATTATFGDVGDELVLISDTIAGKWIVLKENGVALS